MILVTGGAGYIGSVTVSELVTRGYEVVVLDDLSTGHRDVVPTSIPFVQGDIADQALLSSVFADYGVSAVVHFAAKSLVGESVKDPLLYVESNLCKTSAMLRVMQRHNVHALVFSSSAAVYGEPDATPITEDHRKQPISPYGLSKWWIEQVLYWCHTAWGLSPISLRYFNAAGAVPSLSLRERHNPETHLLPRVLSAWAEGEPAQVFGTDYPTSDGSAIRDYVHVQDLATAHVLALEATLKGQAGAYNVGTGRGYSVLEILAAVEQATSTLLPRTYLPRRVGDPAVLVADSTRLQRSLGWRPQQSDLSTIVSSTLAALKTG